MTKTLEIIGKLVANFAMLVFLAMAVYVIYSLVRYLVNEKNFKRGICEARKTEKERVAKVKRMAKQREIGDRICEFLFYCERKSDSRIKTSPGPGNDKIYMIRLGHRDRTPFDHYDIVIRIDLSLPKFQQITVSSEMIGGIEIDQSKIFSARDGEKYIKKLAEQIFSPQV